MTAKACFWVFVISWFAFVPTVFIVRRWYLKRKWGCARCRYHEPVNVAGCLRRMCTASCGNQEGRPCAAWRYKDPEEGAL